MAADHGNQQRYAGKRKQNVRSRQPHPENVAAGNQQPKLCQHIGKQQYAEEARNRLKRRAGKTNIV